MDVTTGPEHEFLGMKFRIRNNEKVEIGMGKQIVDIINDFEKEVRNNFEILNIKE